MGFETLQTAQDEGRALEPITKDEVVFSDQTFTDAVALKMVLQDTILAEQYINSKNLPASWNAADDLYDARVQAAAWPGGSNNAKSNLSMPVVMEAVESLLPQTYMAFFSDPQPFLLEAKGTTSPDAARAMSKVACWAMDQTGFKEEIRKLLKSAFLYGNCIAKWGWETATHKQRVYKRGDATDSVNITVEEKEICKPTFEAVDLRNALVTPDTKCHDIRTSKATIHQSFFTADELDDLRDLFDNVPSREELKQILVDQAEATKDSLEASKQDSWRQDQAQKPTQISSADPLKQNLEILEWTTDGRVVTVLQRTIVLRNEPNEFEVKNYLSCAFKDVVNSFYGFGVAKMLEGEQRLQAGVANKMLDVLSLHADPMYQRKGGIGQQSQNILSQPGKVVNDSGELVVIQIPTITEEGMTVINASESRASRRVGADYGPEMPTQAMRTAEGVQAFTSGVQVQLQYFVEQFANLVFIPAIQAFIELAKNNLTPDQINSILTEAEGAAFKGDVMDVYNGTYKVDVLSSTKLAGRRAAAQMLIPFMQFLAQPPVQEAFTQQNKKVDMVEFTKKVFDLSGYPMAGLIVDMTPDDQQRAQASNPAVIKAKSDQAKQAQQHQNDLETIQAKGEVQGGNKVIGHLLEQSAPEPAKPIAIGK